MQTRPIPPDCNPRNRTLNTALKLATACLLIAGSATAATLNFGGQDIGNPTLKGSFTRNPDGTTTIVGGGGDIWDAADNFYYYYTWAAGQQWDTYVRVRELNGPDAWTKCELMVRVSDTTLGPRAGDSFLANMTTPNSAYNPVGLGQNLIRVQGRTAYSGSCDQFGSTSPTPNYSPEPGVWLRIIRNGSVFTLLSGTNSTTFASVTWYTNAVIDTSKGDVIGVDNATKYTTPFPEVVAVGLAVAAHNDTDPSGGTAIVSDLTATFPAITAPTVIGATVQPRSMTNYAGSEATFQFVTTNNASPNVLTWPRYVNYQWYKNGAAINGATNTVYTFLSATTDDGAQFYCKATILPPYDTTVASLNSQTASLKVLPGTVYTNGLKLEVFANATRQQVEAGNVGAGEISHVDSFDSNGGYGNNHTRRVSGWFIPPTSDTYTFFVAGDDDTDLFLSTDATAANKKLIAQEKGWSPARNWLTMGGGGDDASKRSDQWTDADFNPAWTTATPLVAGQRYYIEAVLHNGTGGDNFGVTCQTATQMAAPDWGLVFTNGAPSLLQATNNNIALITSPVTYLSWVQQPQNLAVYEGEAANFRASVSTDSELAPKYQWYRNGTAVAGATKSTYTISPVALTDNNAEVYVTVRSAVESYALTSEVVTLTVQQAVLERGYAKVEWWAGKLRADVNNGSAGNPDFIYAVPGFEACVNNSNGDNFANRISGFVIPATSGAYDFFVNSDDDSDLFLSTDDKPANKRLIAQQSGWSNPREWLTANDADATLKRSDQFTQDGGVTFPFANGINLTAGTKYYLELVHHDGTGGDNSSATWKKHTDPDPASGTASTLVGNVIGVYAPKCTYVAFTQQPANVSVQPMAIAVLTVAGATDSTMPVGTINAPATNNFLVYQWQKNGVDIPGANAATLDYGPVLPTESGTVFTCKIRALGYVDASQNPLWSNSTPATLTVEQSVFEPGYAKVEYWPAATRAAVNAGTAGAPTWTTYVQQWDMGTDLADQYTRRFSGFFVPPATDSYAFYINADDDADLFLSTDATPANKRIIAQETQWGAGTLHWMDTSGNQNQRVSNSWSPDDGVTTPYASGINLQGNSRYYLEMVQHEGSGGDYAQALYTKMANVYEVTNQQPVNMTGSVIGTFVPRCGYVAFTQQPQSATVESLQRVVFTAAGTSDSAVSVSPNGAPTLDNKPILFQWYKNGQPLAGETRATLVINEAEPADNNAQIMAKIRALGFADDAGNLVWSNSQTATLTVDTTAPVVTAVRSYTDLNANPAAYYVDIGFSKRMNPATVGNVGNYTLTGGATILGVTVSSNGRGVKLTVSGTPAAGATVTVKAGTDAAGTALAANSTMEVQPLALAFKDIGNEGDPAFPSVLYVEGNDAFLVKAQGSDIWNNADGFNFLYEQKTGDFDVVVRQKNISHSSHWAKGGLMVREALTPGSREWCLVNTPLPSDGIMAPDNSGYGTGNVEANYRETTDGATAGWGFGPAHQSAYPNAWVRLQRAGQTLSAYHSVDGRNWTLMATNTPTVALPASLYVGMATTAHNNDPAGTPDDQQVYWNTVQYADYNSSYVPQAAAPTLSYAIAGNQMTITWSPATGTLQQSPTMNGGSWTTVPSTGGSATVTIGTGSMFFRVAE